MRNLVLFMHTTLDFRYDSPPFSTTGSHDHCHPLTADLWSKALKTGKPFFIILTLCCYVLACSPVKNVNQTKPFPVGDYEYTGYDKSGGKIVEGRLSITSVESKRIQAGEMTQIKGNWQFSKVGNQEQIGPQVGSGELIGSIIKGELHINLNPKVSDSNVILKGTIEGKRFHGTWSFNGFAGPMNRGTFEATRK